jgi:hypothetical protein
LAWNFTTAVDLQSISLTWQWCMYFNLDMSCSSNFCSDMRLRPWRGQRRCRGMTNAIATCGLACILERTIWDNYLLNYVDVSSYHCLNRYIKDVIMGWAGQIMVWKPLGKWPLFPEYMQQWQPSHLFPATTSVNLLVWQWAPNRPNGLKPEDEDDESLWHEN